MKNKFLDQIKIKKLRLILLSFFTALTLPFFSNAYAKSYPTRPVTIVVPTTAGGIADITARKMAESLGKKWGQPVIVENRPGAGTLVGAQHFVRQKSDGYTLFMGFNELAILPFLHPSTDIDVTTDFSPVTNIISMPVVLMSSVDFPADSHAEFVKLVKNNPQQYTYGSNGHGSILQILSEKYSNDVDVEMLHIPYKGAQEAITALMSGEIDVVLTVTAPNVVSYIDSGKAKAYAVSTPTGDRAANLPKTPTLQELGYDEFDSYIWYGLFAPRGIDEALLQQIDSDIRGTMEDSELRNYFTNMGAVIDLVGPQDFHQNFVSQHDELGKLVKHVKQN